VSRPTDVEAVHELAELAGLVRAHVEWLVTSGATGAPRAERGAGQPHAPQAARPAPVSSPPSAIAPAPPAAAAPESSPPSRPVQAPIAVSSSRAADATAQSAGQIELVAEPLAAPAVAKPAVLDPAERHRRLDVLADGLRGCTRCALHAGRTQTVFARGSGSSGLCFVGEGPGADEDAQGFPFVGKAGQLLDRMIEAMGFSRDEVYVCNIVKCRPPNNRKPEPEEMAACMPYLREQLELVAPEVMVALGATALQGLFGTTEGITRLRGRWKLYGGRIPVMPTFHPAFLLRNPAAKREVWEDLQAVLRQMGRQPPKR
jgi:DNA polymerase